MTVIDEARLLGPDDGWLCQMRRGSRSFLVFWWLVGWPMNLAIIYGVHSWYLADMIDHAKANPEMARQFLQSISFPCILFVATGVWFILGLLMLFRRDTPLIRWTLLSFNSLLCCMGSLGVLYQKTSLENFMFRQVVCILFWILAVPILYYLCTDDSRKQNAPSLSATEFPFH